MSKFLDELLDDLDEHAPENEQTDEVASDADEYQADEEEEKTEPDDGVTEEVNEVEDEAEASATDEAEDDDDDTEFTDTERKLYGRLKAVQAEREKRQAAIAKAEALQAALDAKEAELAQMQRQTALSAAQNLPDPHDDPTGYANAVAAQYQEALTRQALGFSIQTAVGKYGEAETEAAAKWFENQAQSNPHIPLRENMLSQTDPMEYVVSQYKQAQKMQALASGDYSALVAELQKAGYNISKSEPETASAVAPQATAPIARAPAQTAPAAPKRSKLAATASATTAPTEKLSMMDLVTRRN